MLKAAIDIGTNTCRLLIGDEAGGTIRHLLVKRHITRLGGGFDKASGLSVAAIERTRAALADFADEIRMAGVARTRAVATSAVRDAANGEAFCRMIEETTGIRLEVIGGEEEGMLTLRGALAGLDDREGDFLVFDIGGGSTEYTISRGESPVFAASLPLGVVRLMEGKHGLEEMREKIARELAVLHRKLAGTAVSVDPEATTLVATAGTATTVAAIDLRLETYDYRLVNNHVLSMERIREIFDLILPLPLAERLRIPGLEKGREDLIVPGLLIMLATLESFGFDRLKVNDFGLLEGVFLSA